MGSCRSKMATDQQASGPNTEEQNANTVPGPQKKVQKKIKLVEQLCRYTRWNRFNGKR